MQNNGTQAGLVPAAAVPRPGQSPQHTESLHLGEARPSQSVPPCTNKTKLTVDLRRMILELFPLLWYQGRGI